MGSKKQLVQSQALLHVPIEKVFGAFTNPAAIASWLDLDALVELRIEGKYELYSRTSTNHEEEKRELVLDAQVTEVAFPTRLVLTWKGGTLDLNLETGLGGTHVDLATEGTTVWEDALERLNAALEAQHH